MVANESNGEIVLSLRGGLTFASCRKLLSYLQQLAAHPGRIALDLSRVDELDMSGLTVLLRAERGLPGRLSIIDASVAVQRVLNLVEPALGRVSWPGRRPLTD